MKKEPIKIPSYMVSESKDENIFDLNVEDLVFEKMFLLFEKLMPLEKELEDTKAEMQIKKDKLLLETDFKSVLNESRPTIAMKDAYIKPFIAEEENKIDTLTEQITFNKNKLVIINDLLKVKREMLKIEGGLLE